MQMQMHTTTLNSRGLTRPLHSVDFRPTQVCGVNQRRANKNTRVQAFMGASSSGNHLNVQKAEQVNAMQHHFTESQTLLRPSTSVVLDSVSCMPALTSAVLHLSRSLQHPKAQACLAASEQGNVGASHHRTLQMDLLSSLQMIPSTNPANLAASARAARDTFQASLQMQMPTTSIQMPSLILSQAAAAFDRPAFGALQGLGLMVLVAGAYVMMLVSSFLFGDAAEPAFALPKKNARRKTIRNRFRYQMSTTPYPAKRQQRMTRVKRASSAMPMKKQRTRPVTAPLADITPQIVPLNMFDDRVCAYTGPASLSTKYKMSGKRMAMHPYMMNLLLQADPPPQLRRYPAMKLQRGATTSPFSLRNR